MVMSVNFIRFHKKTDLIMYRVNFSNSNWLDVIFKQY